MRGFITDPQGYFGLRLAHDLPEPEPAPDQFLLEVRAYSINPGEARLITLRPDGWRPGQDVAGIVRQAAANGSGPPEGARIAARVDWEGWAERVAVPSQSAAVLDDRVSFEQAATLPIAGLTALRALRVGNSVLGRNVLVTGATGGVGQFAVQLAVLSGARVTAQVSSPEREEEARELGAHQVVTSLDDAMLGPFHLVLDGVGGPQLKQAVHLMTREATVVLYGGPGGPTELRLGDFYASAWNGRLVGFVSELPEETKGEDIGILATLVADGRLAPWIGWRSSWTSTPDAFEALAKRSFRGKAVLVRETP
jgi:NADPH:quinone reductase-like Zn-dependent oxidoreductase